jgi:hypothetical protein
MPVCVCACVCACVRISVCIYIDRYIYVYMCVCVCACIQANYPLNPDRSADLCLRTVYHPEKWPLRLTVFDSAVRRRILCFVYLFEL